MAAPCTEHLFLTGEKGVGKSTLARHLLAGHTPCGFRTVRVTGVMDRPSVHLLPAVGGEATADNLLFYCGEYDPSRFDTLGTAALSQRYGDVLLMDELGFLERDARRFQKAVLAALQGDQPVLAAVKNRNDPFLQAVRGAPGVRVLYITRENREGLFRLLERDLAQAE